MKSGKKLADPPPFLLFDKASGLFHDESVLAHFP
jgi:hypothetical protein